MSDDQAAVGGTAVDLTCPVTLPAAWSGTRAPLSNRRAISGLFLIGGCGTGLDLLAVARAF
jgi:hypothetical protein